MAEIQEPRKLTPWEKSLRIAIIRWAYNWGRIEQAQCLLYLFNLPEM